MFSYECIVELLTFPAICYTHFTQICKWSAHYKSWICNNTKKKQTVDSNRHCWKTTAESMNIIFIISYQSPLAFVHLILSTHVVNRIQWAYGICMGDRLKKLCVSCKFYFLPAHFARNWTGITVFEIKSYNETHIHLNMKVSITFITWHLLSSWMFNYFSFINRHRFENKYTEKEGETT